ncbi:MULTISPECIES: LysR family transcriptional regulator [Tenebrionibacter/Tenebrionicola group]|jgi:DNA-binding transcriptional LysR family regulator|uniref:LysR family transcriptional regulator n=2 Tax=Tenebrionibacter/Tenebrionicola group TaxID=2969848 RepID=A0A8K0V7J8_9ENTR|nr:MULTISPECIES: LysR family transcriptional regulator [Tenebrionibacter/Tenebrionicola group]MBK4715615.1 LysR family transcriptional regulator [Tenebrionibacter intestinalis]MBV4412921.1 LysR family transcriptional regulator [Tenebrionicola larvae]MBV5094601.1 LysR family transcriptional regulator [Tenebrionicola larvae]
MDNFATIPFFIAVVETGSFSAAAKKLSITKSAVSKRISQFEDDLGIRLLNRTTRKLSLTEAGVKYYEYVRAASQLAKEGEDAISRMQDRAQGLLRISVPMVFGRLHIAPLMPKFLQENPQIEVHMSMDDRMVDLVGEGFDMGIRIGQLSDSSLIARPLSPCSSVLCASPDYLRQHGEPKTLEDLQHHNCLFYSYFRGGAAWSFTGPGGLERFIPRGNYQVNNSEVLYEALLAGMGICQMPKFIIGPALADGRLVPLLPDYHLPLHNVYAVYPQRRFMPEKMRLLLEFFAQQFNETSAYRLTYEN